MAELNILTQEQYDTYWNEGFIVLESIIPEDVLGVASKVCRDFEDRVIREWVEKGLIDHNFSELPLESRFVEAWTKAGKPDYDRRSILKNNIYPRMYELIKSDVFINVAKDLFSTSEISADGMNNIRQKHGALPWSAIPWHADIYYWDEYALNWPLDFVVMWYPLQEVGEDKGCLQIVSKKEKDGRDYKLQDGKVILPDNVVEGCTINNVAMKRGDLLIMTEDVLHRSVMNKTDELIWTLDHRYQETAKASILARKHGIVASSKDERYLTSCDDWMKKRAS